MPKHKNKKYFLNKLRGKLSLLIKFGYFLPYHLNNYKKFQENYVPSPYEFAKNQAQTLLENESKLLMSDMY